MKQIVFMLRIRLKSALQPGKYNVHQQTNAVIIIYVFECTIVNLATYTQFKNAA